MKKFFVLIGFLIIVTVSLAHDWHHPHSDPKLALLELGGFKANPPPMPVCLLWGQSFKGRDDYKYIADVGNYKLHTRAVPWNEARMICEEEGGHLAIINSMREANAVAGLFRDSEPITGSPHPDFAHIGFHDFYQEGQHITIHGQTLARAGFNRWIAGQPDNNGDNENCGSIQRNGELNDINCEVKLGFVCEISIYH